jgi:hypothetical protein
MAKGNKLLMENDMNEDWDIWGSKNSLGKNEFYFKYTWFASTQETSMHTPNTAQKDRSGAGNLKDSYRKTRLAMLTSKVKFS